jgi:hypothetical protein
MAAKKTTTRAPDTRKNIILLKGSAAYRDWFDGLSKSTLIEGATIVRDALTAWALARKLPSPPEDSLVPRRKRND